MSQVMGPMIPINYFFAVIIYPCSIGINKLL